MKSLLGSLGRRLKTRRVPHAGCDCSDFVTAVPDPVHHAQLLSLVRARHTSTSTPPHDEDRVRGTVFDLHYRCGAAGRCALNVPSAPPCRFPCCIAMRPRCKGAEVWAVRSAFESGLAAPALWQDTATRALLHRARHEDALTAVVDEIGAHVAALLTTAARGRPLQTRLRPDEDTFAPAVPVHGPGSAVDGVNPLTESTALCEVVCGLYCWRAALLVNLRRDHDAVHSLLNLSDLVPETHRPALYSAATNWATLNDMEIVYYRGLLRQYEPFALARHFAHARPLLLPYVFEALTQLSSATRDTCTRDCAGLVLGKEIDTLLTRTQPPLDLTEDPTTSLCLPLALHYYRFRVHASFWGYFLHFLCLPPMPAATTTTTTTTTPPHVLDAVGRATLLHHLLHLTAARVREREGGAMARRVRRRRASGEVTVSDYDPILSPHETQVAQIRLQQLLVLAHGYEEGRRCVSDTSPTPPLPRDV